MSAWFRWKLATPLILLSLLMLVPALFGTVMWWSEFGLAYRLLSIAICLVVVVQLGIAVSIGARPARDVPWLRVGLVLAAILASCGLAARRSSV
ncbi:hypothetical protein O7598_15070 [Micromonospora sp. WMMC241]|uniref:hypothetical protein n=1 Tax=Micromonospora sp. WMMC241 TaxID=3015159 RepID=UPI0022B5F9F0|nr:hypothetical protein [Micromonospora sp. WMMC241]MCZ7437727.1 hypothetical protein [Micromonospora sp. WMMC241]